MSDAARDLAPTPVPDGTNITAEVEAIVADARTSFAAGMRILTRDRRQAMYAIYAFARVVDDIADGDLPSAEKHRLLDAWRGEIEAVYAGTAKSLVGRALTGPIARYELPKEEFLLLIEGMEMDCDAPIVAPSLPTLLSYTRRVAGAVGLLSMRCFGAWIGPPSARFALALADALQLTNILRDVEEDAAIGRLYLPREILQRYGITSEDPMEVAADPRLQGVCAEIGARARAGFAAARAEMPAHSRTRLAPAMMMMGVYEGYLNLMAARDFCRAPEPISLSRRQKIALSLRYALAPPPLAPNVRRA
ncbi:MAG: presqualene diphosphate synthase HpnD [Pseudomonadota bacterium]